MFHMEPEPQGAETAASPTADPAASAAAFEAEFDAVNEGRAQQGETAAEGKQKASEATQEAPGDTGQKQGQKPEKVARRMEQLLRDRRAAAEAQQKAERELAEKEVRYSAALKKVLSDVELLRERLGQYEDVDSSDFKLREIESRQRARDQVQERERELSKTFEQRRERAMVEEAKAELEDSMREALSDLPHITVEQLRAKFKEHAAKNPDVRFEDAPELFKSLAAAIDEELLSRYEARALEKHKAKLGAPSSISSGGSVRAQSAARSRQEMIDDLERVAPDMFR